MPTDNTTDTLTLASGAAAIRAAAEQSNVDKANKKAVDALSAKYRVIAKRKRQLNDFVTRVTKLFTDFDAAIEAAGTDAEAVLKACEDSNFHSRILTNHVSQDA